MFKFILPRVDDHEDILDVAKIVLSLYSLPVLAITNGPDAAYLFDSTHSTITATALQPQSQQSIAQSNHPSINPSNRTYKCFKYSIPNVVDLITEDDDLDAFINKTSSSLPEPTGLDPNTRVLGSHGDLVGISRGACTFGMSRQASVHDTIAADFFGNRLKSGAAGPGNVIRRTENEIRVNPLGAGDTCAGVFLIEYLDSRVKSMTIFAYFSLFQKSTPISNESSSTS